MGNTDLVTTSVRRGQQAAPSLWGGGIGCPSPTLQLWAVRAWVCRCVGCMRMLCYSKVIGVPTSYLLNLQVACCCLTCCCFCQPTWLRSLVRFVRGCPPRLPSKHTAPPNN